MQNPGVLWFMIKQWQFAIKMMITVEELTGIIQSCGRWAATIAAMFPLTNWPFRAL
jgi:hypothetical protein